MQMGRNSSFLSVGLTAIIMLSMILSTVHLFGSGSTDGSDRIEALSDISEESNFQTRSTGNTYYVDAVSGIDSNSGLSTSSAWKTVQRVASKTLQPGDTVRFKRGQTFKITSATGYLKLYEDGNASNWITIETYGTGAKPIIDGQDLPDNCIYVRGDYYIIRDLEVINSDNQAVLISNHDTLLENLDVHESGNCGIIHYGGGYNFVVKNCTTYNITNTGIALMGSSVNKLRDTLLENCTTYNCGNDGISIHKTGGGATAGANHTIRNCVGYSNPEEAIDIQTGLNVTVENCLGYNNSRGSFVLSPDIDCVVRNCLFYGSGGGYEFAIVGTESLKMYNNIIINGQGESKSKLMLISDENGPADNIEIYDNILVDTGGGKWSERLIWIDDMDADKTLGSITIKNNIMISHRPFYYFRNKAANSSDVVIDGNIYYHLTDSFSYGGSNFTQWQSKYGHDINGMEADPLVRNYYGLTASAFKLKSNSPAIDRGINTGMIDDLLYNPIYGTNDIGAMEYQPPYVLGDDEIDVTGEIRIYDDGRYQYSDIPSKGDLADLSMKPVGGWKKETDTTPRDVVMDIDIKVWNLSGDTYRKWSESSDDPIGNMTYKIGDMIPNGNYIIGIGDDDSTVGRADSSGYLEFTVDSNTKSRDIDIKLGSGSLFSSDKSTKEATTGDIFTMSIEALDNKGVSSVHVEYWLGSGGTHTNKTMTRKSGDSFIGMYAFDITFASDAAGTINYKFSARNTQGKWINTAVHTHQIVDNDPPVITLDSTPSSINNGNNLLFKFSFQDNIGIRRAVLSYWYNGDDIVDINLKEENDFSHSLVITREQALDISYCVNVTDDSSLWTCSQTKIVDVVDNLLPQISDFRIDGTPTTGEDIRISMVVSDNVDISKVDFEYWFGTGIHLNELLEGPDYNLTIGIPESSISPLNYRITILDISGNENISGINTIQTMDNDPPVLLGDQSDTNIKLGEDYMVAFEFHDNINIKEVVIDYWFGVDHTVTEMSPYGDVYKVLIEIPETPSHDLHYNVRATDTSENHFTTPDRPGSSQR